MEPVEVNNLIPLVKVQPGRCVHVVRLDGGAGLRERLRSMGLVPGIPVKVIGDHGGPVILDVLGGRLMLGRGMASQIMVRMG